MHNDPCAHAPLLCLKVKRYTGFNWLGVEFNNNEPVAESASPFLAGGSWMEAVRLCLLTSSGRRILNVA